MKYCCELFEARVTEKTIERIKNYFYGLRFHIKRNIGEIDDPEFPSPISTWLIIDYCPFCGKRLEEKDG